MYQILMNFTIACQMSWNLTKSYHISLNYTKSHHISLILTKSQLIPKLNVRVELHVGQYYGGDVHCFGYIFCEFDVFVTISQKRMGWFVQIWYSNQLQSGLDAAKIYLGSVPKWILCPLFRKFCMFVVIYLRWRILARIV